MMSGVLPEEFSFSTPKEESDRWALSVQRNKELLFSVEHAVLNMVGSELPNLHDFGFLNEESPECDWDDDERQAEFFEQLKSRLEDAVLSSIIHQDHCMVLMGFEFPNPFGLIHITYAKFPREAYYQWWKADPHGLPCPAWFDDLRKADEALEADKCNDEADERQGAQPLAEDQVSGTSVKEIVPGVTVDDIRAMLDKDSPAYCPRLLAAVMTKIAIMPREEKDAQGFAELPAVKESAYKNAVEKESAKHLKSVGVVSCNDGGKNRDPAKGDIASVCRILWRTLDGKNGRPKNQ